MKISLLNFAKYALFVGVVILLFIILLPRKYAVPQLHKRSTTQYWQLPTGSLIAFTKISARRTKKPFSIVYLHGGPGGHIQDNLIKTLTPLADEGYDIYFYDQIGSGLSNRLTNIRDYTVDRHIRDLESIIQTLGVQKVILIGQSWGAILATQFTAAHPEKIYRLVLTSPGPIYPLQRKLAPLSAPDSFHLRSPFYTNEEGNQKANNLRTKAVSLLATHFGWKLTSDNEADAFATYLNYEVDRSTVCDTAKIPTMDAGNGFYAGIMTFHDLLQVHDIRSSLRTLETPVLVIKGQCDNLPWGYTSEYLNVFRHHQLTVIPGAGHYIWLEQPALYLSSLSQFLGEPKPAPGDNRRLTNNN